jgi:hypothetical protein
MDDPEIAAVNNDDDEESRPPPQADPDKGQTFSSAIKRSIRSIKIPA